MMLSFGSMIVANSFDGSRALRPHWPKNHGTTQWKNW